MSEDKPAEHRHTIRERLDAATAAAEEVVAEESGQLGGQVSALAVPFEEIVAAVSAAIHPDSSSDGGAHAPADGPGPTGGDPPPPGAVASDH